MSLNNRVTMRDVAKAASVDQSTVSLALRNDRRLPEATRERIARLAQEMGYRPHPLLSVLGSVRKARRATDSGSVLAYVMQAHEISEARQEYLAGAKSAGAEQGYKVEPFIMGEAGLSPQRLHSVLMARNIHGVIIAPLPEAHGTVDLDWTQFCVVAIEYTLSDPAVDRVVGDYYGTMRLIMNECRRREIRRVGLVLSNNAEVRTEGLTSAGYWIEQKNGRYFPPIPPLYMDRWADATVSRWLQQHRPEIIITSGVFIKPLQEMEQREGWEVPGKISLLNINTGRTPRAGGIYQNRDELGQVAAQLLIDKINRNDRGVSPLQKTVIIPGIWVEGETMRPAQGR